MMNSRSRRLPLLSLVVLAAPALAQQRLPATVPPTTAESGAAAAEDIVVTATSVATIDERPIVDTPRTVQAVSGALIAQTSPSSPQELVRFFAGVTPNRNFTSQVSDYSARGVSTSVRRDGLQLIRVNVPLEDIERVELLQGVGDATQAGEKTPGGILNFVPKRPLLTDFTRTNLVITGYGNILGQADVNMAIDDRTAIRVNVGLERVHFANDTKGSRQAIVVAGRREIAPGITLDLNAYYNRAPQHGQSYGYIPYLDTAGNRLDLSARRDYGQEWTHNKFSTALGEARLGGDLGAGWTFSIGGNYYRVWERSIEATPFFGVAPNGATDLYAFQSNQNFDGAAARATLAKEFAIGGSIRNRIAAIADHTRYTSEGAQENFFPSANFYTGLKVPRPAFNDLPRNLSGKLRVSGLALQDEMTLFDRLTLSAGVRRYILNQKSYDGTSAETVLSEVAVRAWLPNYSALLKITPRWSVYASSFKALEPGNFANSGYVNFGEQLPPLKSRTIEAGTKYQVGSLVASLSYYHFKRPSALAEAATDANGKPGFLLTQNGATRFEGFDLSVSGRILPRLNVVGTVALVDSKIVRTDNPAIVGKEQPDTPKWAATLYAEYEPVSSWFVSGAVKYSGRQLADDFALRVPGYTIFDAGLRHDMTLGATPLHLGLLVQNLTDKLYFPVTLFNAVQFGGPRTVKVSIGADF